MSIWTPCTLGDVLTLQRGFDLPNQSRRAGRVPIVSSSGVSGYHDEARAQGPGVVIGRYGTLGEVHFVLGDYWPLNTTLWVKDFKGNDPRFCSYLLQTVGIAETSSAAAVPGVNRNVLHLLPVIRPDLDIQRRIASILGAYDDLIEVNRRRVAVLEEMARGLFEEWFVRFRFPGYETVPILDTPDGPLPDGWRWGAFQDLASEVRASISPGDVGADTAYVGLEHLPRRSTTLDQIGRAGDVSSLKLEFRKGDILFGKIRPYFHKVAWASIGGVCSTDAIVWRPISGSTAQALALASSDAFVAHSVQTSNGTKMPRANARVLADYWCAIAPPYLSQSFEQVAVPLIELAASLQSASTRLAASRDLLLPRLISGQLSVASAERELEKVA